MRTKNLAIIFILFLLITLGSGLTVFLTGGKDKPVSNQTEAIVNPVVQSSTVEEKTKEAAENQLATKTVNEAKPAESEPATESGKIAQPGTVDGQAEQIQATLLIDNVKYETKVAVGSSVYDLMVLLKNQGKIDFKVKNYLELGFFIDEINGVKNDPSGMNWLYYVNGKSAQIGVSYYLIKAGDQIEWKYENKSF